LRPGRHLLTVHLTGPDLDDPTQPTACVSR
jgi:hypothetical protein